MPSSQPAYIRAKEYASREAESLKHLGLMEFFKSVHEKFYQDIEVKFMDYFLSIAQREGEFIVHHSALRDYGVMTSEQSTHVKRKLDDLGLVEGQDYQLTDATR